MSEYVKFILPEKCQEKIREIMLVLNGHSYSEIMQILEGVKNNIESFPIPIKFPLERPKDEPEFLRVKENGAITTESC